MPLTEVQKLCGDNSNFSRSPSESIEACFHYLSNKGIMLWYNERKDYIHNNIDNILKVHKELFRHDLEKIFVFEMSYKRFIQDEKQFNLHKSYFFTSGLLHKCLLRCLWASFDMSDYEQDVKIKLLKVNDHCFEDISVYGNTLTPLASSLRFP